MPGYSCACRAKDLPTHDIGPLEIACGIVYGSVSSVWSPRRSSRVAAEVSSPRPCDDRTDDRTDQYPEFYPQGHADVAHADQHRSAGRADGDAKNAGRTDEFGCTGVAVVSIGTVGASTPITVTAAANGSCTLVVQDATNQRVTIPITVSAPVPCRRRRSTRITSHSS